MDKIDTAAKVIWNYMILDQNIGSADVVLILGSIDDNVAEYGAKLFLKGYGDWLVISGGKASSNFMLKKWEEHTEAEHFANVAVAMGVPKEKILLEKKATNTGENVLFTYELFQKKNLSLKSLLIVQKPYMERRTYATFKKQWPDKNTKIMVTSSPFAYEDYFKADGSVPKDTIISIMVGDLQRIMEYPKLGYQISQTIPQEVIQAYEELVALGYNKHLISN